jgi:D-alanyl-lipoteichoic acid acyltransferase DltB (MBOAT superfamily)
MLFNSFEFIFFFVIFYCLYLVLSHRSQNILILIGSYFFYGFWDWKFLSLIAISTVIDFLCGKRIERETTSKRKKLFLNISLFSNLGMLGFFKYFNFFTFEATNLLSLFGFNFNVHLLEIILPVGISFYTFQTMSYTLDIYRGQLKSTKPPMLGKLEPEFLI